MSGILHHNSIVQTGIDVGVDWRAASARADNLKAAVHRRRGVDPCRTQIIAHSLGTIAAAQAAVCLSDRGPLRQLTLLDPPEAYHEEIFCCLRPTRHACVVENYWTPGLSGYGAHVDCLGVQNYLVKGPTPIRGIVDLSTSNHVYVMRWYYKTMRCPTMRCGFQNSCFLRHCDGNRPCYSADESGTNASNSAEVLDVQYPASICSAQ